jgi:hypothetical protein
MSISSLVGAEAKLMITASIASAVAGIVSMLTTVVVIVLFQLFPKLQSPNLPIKIYFHEKHKALTIKQIKCKGMTI